MENQHLYALLVGIGDYEKMNISNLGTYRMDLNLIGTAIISGLKCPRDHIRVLAGNDNNGYVSTTDLAKAINGFKALLSNDDTFIFYYSGHGLDERLIFSNGQLELQSVIDFIDNLTAKNKLVILDCCHAGDFKTAGVKKFMFMDSVDCFAEHGIAVLASTSGDELARLDTDNNHSMFTGSLSTAIVSNRSVRRGLLDLNDIYAETKRLVEIWNKKNPGKEQTPVFRTCLGGTIYFPVEEYKPYEAMQFSVETDRYTVDRVEPLSTVSEKRLCAFVVLKSEYSKEEIAEIAKEISEGIKYADVYSSEKFEYLFEGTSAKCVWIYYGYDNSDMINRLHAMYTIWAAPDVRNKYYKPNSYSEIVDDIYIWHNTSYTMLKEMQKPTVSRAEYILQNKKFLSIFINMAGQFVVDMQAVANEELTPEDLQRRYREWVILVKERYINLSDLDVPPDDLRDWSNEISNLAGCVLNLSFMLEGDKNNHEITDREQWLINDSVRQYNESLKRLADIEKNTVF